MNHDLTIAGGWSVYLTVDEDDHLTINVNHVDGSEVIDCEVEGPDDVEFKVRLTTKQTEADHRKARGCDWL